MSKIKLFISALLLVLLSTGAGAQSGVCLDFEDLKPGDRYGTSSNQAAGAVFYEKEGILVGLDSFYYPNGTKGFLDLLIEDAQTYDSTQTGVALFPSNINLRFKLDNLPEGKKQACFDFRYYGGDINLSINDADPIVVSSFADFILLANASFDNFDVTLSNVSSTRLAGTLCVGGEDLESILIGGQELLMDNFCVRYNDTNPNGCTIRNLTALPQPCTPNEIFYLDLKFESEQDTGQYMVLVNNQQFGPYNYPIDSSLNIGPIKTYGDLFYNVTVYDVENPDCQESTQFRHSCIDFCSINDLVVEAELCEGDSLARVYLDFNVDVPHIANTTFKVWIDSTEFGEISLLRLPYTLEIPASLLDGEEVPFTVCISPNLATGEECCVSGTILVKPCETQCEIEAVKAKILECYDGLYYDLYIDADFTHQYRDAPVAVYVDGIAVDTVRSGSFPITLEKAPVFTEATTFPVKLCQLWSSDATTPENCCQSIRLDKRDCERPCPIESINAKITDCLPNGNFDILLKVDYSANYEGTAFMVYAEGEELGIYEAREEGVQLKNVPIYTDALDFELKVCPISLTTGGPAFDCCQYIRLNKEDCGNEPPSGDCTYFDDLDAQVFSGAEYAPGSEIFSVDDIQVRLFELQNLDWTTGYESLSIKSAANLPDFEAASGQLLYYDQISSILSFANYEGVVEKVSVDFYNLGSHINVSANGSPVQIISFLSPGVYPLGNGVDVEILFPSIDGTQGTMTFYGNITALLIGGDQLALDNLCVNQEEAPCEIGELALKATECDENGQFYLQLDFRYKNTSDYFIAATSNNRRERFNYDELPVKLGPFNAPQDQLVVEVYDAEKEACASRAEFGPYRCDTPCVINEVKAYDIECDPTTGLYNFSLKIDGENLEGVLTLGNENGFIKRFEYNGEPVRISGVPLPNSRVDVLTICANPQPADGFECCYTFEVALDCGPIPCEIYEVKAYDIECDPATGLYHFTLKVDGDNLGTVMSLSNENGFIKRFAYEGDPIRISGVPLPNGRFDKLVLCAGLQPNDAYECCYEFRVELDCMPECSIESVEAFDIECFPDGTYSFSLKMRGNNIENEAFVLQTRKGYETKFRLDGNIVRIDNVPLPETNSGIEWVKICRADDATSDCCYELEFRVDCIDNCGFADAKLFDFECYGDSLYSVSLKVEGPERLIGQVFALKTEGGFEKRFEWNGEAVRLEGIPTLDNDGVDRMKICVVNLPDCCLEISYAIECDSQPNCQFGELKAETTPCEADGSFFIELNFRHENTSDGFEVFVNDRAVGAYRYEDLPIRVGPIGPDFGNSNQYEVKVKDWEKDCYVSTKVEGCGTTSNCTIGSVDIITKDCKDGFFDVVAELTLANKKEGQFLVFVEGELFGPYQYSKDQRIEMGPFRGDGMTSYDFLFVDANDPTCFYYEEIGTVDCDDEPNCRIADLEAKVLDCNDDGSYRVYIDFKYEGADNEFFDIFTSNGMILKTYRLDELPLEVDLNFPEDSKRQHLSICINDSPNCCISTEIELPDCEDDCEGLSFRATPTTCDSNGLFNIKLAVDLDLTVIYPIVIEVNGVFYDSVQIANPNFEIGPFPADSSYEISIIDVWHPACVSSLDLGKVSCEEDCNIREVKIDLVNCQPNNTYELYIDIDYEGDTNRVFELVGANGEKIRSFKASQLPIIVPEVKISPNEPYLSICDKESNCCVKTFVQFPECIPCNFTEVEGYVSECLGDSAFYIGIKSDWKLEELDHYIVTRGDIAYPFLINDSIGLVQIGPFTTTNTASTYTFLLNDSRNPDCAQRFQVSVQDACQSSEDDDVWPGDANQDNIANHLDLINLGIAWGKEGPSRTLSGSRWTGVPASSWGDRFSDAANSGDFKHADCNGDGIVNGDDIDVIRKNYNLRHGQLESPIELPATDFDPPIFFEVPDTEGLPDSGYFNIPIVLGSAEAPLSNIYGVAFTVEFDPQVINPDEIEVTYPTSWLGEPGVNLQTLSYKYIGPGKIEIAITRTDQNEVSGYGVVAMFRGIRDDIVGRSESQLDVSRSFAVRADQSFVALNGIKQTAQFKPKVADRKYGLIDLKRGMRVYPNPASSTINVDNFFGVPIDALQILTPNGRVMSPRYEGTTTLDVSDLPDGLYLIRVEIDGYIIHQKLFKSKSW